MFAVAAAFALCLSCGVQDSRPPPDAAPADSARARLLLPLYTGFAVLQGIDAYQTWNAVRGGGAELNPLLSPVAGNVYGLAALKAAGTTATIVAVDRLRRRHPRAALVLMIAIDAGMSAIVARNAQERAGS